MGTAPQREQHDAHKLTRVRERYQRARGATTRAIRRAQNNGKVARAIPTCAPQHNESDLMRAKQRQGCESDISTVAQRERSDGRKTTRGVRGRYQNEPCSKPVVTLLAGS